MKVKWTTKYPTKEGNYWFYGYRYGKVSVGSPDKPQWMVVQVHSCGNGLLVVDSGGQFLYENEIEEGHFAPLTLPEFPEVSEPYTEGCKKCYGHGTIMHNETCPDCDGNGGR